MAQADLRLAQAAQIHFATTAAQSRFIQTRDALTQKNLPREKKTSLQATLRQLLQEESKRARDLYHLQQQDSRIGFEASNHYYYLPQDLQEKFLNCQHLLESLAP